MNNPEKKFNGYIIAKEGYKPLIVSGEALKKLAKKGKLRADDLVFCDFEKVWKKARNVKGLRTFFAKRSPNFKGSVSEHDLHQDEKDYDVIAAIEQENLSCLQTVSNQSGNNGVHGNFLNSNTQHFTEDESLRDAVEYLRNGAPSDDNFAPDSWSGLFNPVIIFGFLALLTLGFLGYYILFIKNATTT
ncbi:MAG: hypothetical protein EBT92_15915 [Planctomycetes bacterium]|nr:hypothetical protein [Planctomycetota bacterium]NBY01729.1 hypothetical protein [Planctomycetota bacterium]